MLEGSQLLSKLQFLTQIPAKQTVFPKRSITKRSIAFANVQKITNWFGPLLPFGWLKKWFSIWFMAFNLIWNLVKQNWFNFATFDRFIHFYYWYRRRWSNQGRIVDVAKLPDNTLHTKRQSQSQVCIQGKS